MGIEITVMLVTYAILLVALVWDKRCLPFFPQRNFWSFMLLVALVKVTDCTVTIHAEAVGFGWAEMNPVLDVIGMTPLNIVGMVGGWGSLILMGGWGIVLLAERFGAIVGFETLPRVVVAQGTMSFFIVFFLIFMGMSALAPATWLYYCF